MLKCFLFFEFLVKELFLNFAYCLVPCCECSLCISYLGIAIFDTDLLHFLILTSIPSVEETTAASLQRIPCQNGILDLLFMTVDLRLVPRSVITFYLFGVKISIFWFRIFSVHVVSILSLIISILGVFYIENLVLYHIPLVLFFQKFEESTTVISIILGFDYSYFENFLNRRYHDYLLGNSGAGINPLGLAQVPNFCSTYWVCRARLTCEYSFIF